MTSARSYRQTVPERQAVRMRGLGIKNVTLSGHQHKWRNTAYYAACCPIITRHENTVSVHHFTICIRLPLFIYSDQKQPAIFSFIQGKHQCKTLWHDLLFCSGIAVFRNIIYSDTILVADIRKKFIFAAQ